MKPFPKRPTIRRRDDLAPVKAFGLVMALAVALIASAIFTPAPKVASKVNVTIASKTDETGWPFTEERQ